jgi:hypothetical protein
MQLGTRANAIEPEELRRFMDNKKFKTALQEYNDPDLIVAAVVDFLKGLHGEETPSNYAQNLAEHRQVDSDKAGIDLVEFLEIHYERVQETGLFLNPATAPARMNSRPSSWHFHWNFPRFASKSIYCTKCILIRRFYPGVDTFLIN